MPGGDYLFEVVQRVPAAGGGFYNLEVYGAAEGSLEAAAAVAARQVARFDTGPAARGPHFAVLRLFCRRCCAHGIEPGFKKKPCLACGGRGSTEIARGAVFPLPESAPAGAREGT